MNIPGRLLALFGGDLLAAHHPSLSLLGSLSHFSRGVATHGISEAGPKTAGLVRFYKHVGVKQAPGQVCCFSF